MRVPLSWLKDYVDIEIPVAELAERMTLAGLEVEKIDYIGVEGSDLVWDRDKFVIAQVLEVKPHPNADRLVLAIVDHGAGETETLVTGAPNLFPYLGMKLEGMVAPMVMEGATIYDGHKEGLVKSKLKGRPVRGIMNRHMLCSEKELGLSELHEEIILFPSDAAPGTPLQDVLGDVVLHLDLTPNLARCQSVLEVGREVAALLGATFRYPSLEVQAEGLKSAEKVEVVIEDGKDSPRFTATIIEDMEIKPSPYWMQHRLKLAGMRPINNVVDITNYVMLELGQPLHAFDYDLLVKRAKGEKPCITVRLAHENEGMTTLDGVERKFNPYDILITDSAGAVGIGGVMGGMDTEVNGTTSNLLLEAASFNRINIRRTAQAHRLPSEASARFGRGVHPAQAIRGSKRASEMFRLYAGGKVSVEAVDNYPGKPEPVVAQVTSDDIRRALGIDIPLDTAGAILESLGFSVGIADQTITATAPDNRLDVHEGITGTADLIEEIARIYGYDKIPVTEMGDRLPPLRANREVELEDDARDILVRAGLQEIISYRFTTPEAEARLVPPSGELDQREYVTMANPISQDKTALRHTLLERLLSATALNIRHLSMVALFEIGQVYLPDPDSSLPLEPIKLGLAAAGCARIQSWVDQETKEEAVDFFYLKGIIDLLAKELKLEPLSYAPTSHQTFSPGRVAQVLLDDGTVIGVMGELHPLVQERFGLPDDIPVIAAELDLTALMQAVPARFKVDAVPQFPAVYRDIALVVDADLPAVEVEKLIRQTGGVLLDEVRLFDLYQGEQLPQGKKSLAYALAFRSPSKTLNDKEANKQRDRIVKRLEKVLGARLRS